MHTIRLRGPWEKRIGDRTSTRVSVPEPPTKSREVALSSDGDGTTWYVRKFNRPSGLGLRDHVYLRITRWSGAMKSVRLNDHPIPLADPPLEVDITLLLQPHNQLVLELTSHGGSPPSLSGEVALLIDSREDP